jgi:hypothetical protein
MGIYEDEMWRAFADADAADAVMRAEFDEIDDEALLDAEVARRWDDHAYNPDALAWDGYAKCEPFASFPDVSYPCCWDPECDEDGECLDGAARRASWIARQAFVRAQLAAAEAELAPERAPEAEAAALEFGVARRFAAFRRALADVYGGQ